MSPQVYKDRTHTHTHSHWYLKEVKSFLKHLLFTLQWTCSQSDTCASPLGFFFLTFYIPCWKEQTCVILGKWKDQRHHSDYRPHPKTQTFLSSPPESVFSFSIFFYFSCNRRDFLSSGCSKNKKTKTNVSDIRSNQGRVFVVTEQTHTHTQLSWLQLQFNAGNISCY